MGGLFQKIDFKSHSGIDLTWKIEMDALGKKEWKFVHFYLAIPCD